MGSEDKTIATLFEQQASDQVNPVYDQAQAGLQSQIPSIQNLYQTLTSGLQQQNQQQLTSGVNGIVEDANQRGVLRSTLPVDARQSLTAQLGAALNQSLGQLNVQQAGDIGKVTSQIGDLNIDRVKTIQNVAGSLQARDLAERQAQLQQQQADRDYALKVQEFNMQQAASKAAATAQSPTAAQNLQMATAALAQALRGKAGADGYVSPQSYAAGRQEWVGAGFSSKQYDEIFSGYKNPQNNNYKYF